MNCKSINDTFLSIVYFRCIDLLVHKYFYIFRSEYNQYALCTCSCTVEKKRVPFSMAIGNGGTHAQVFSETLAHWNSKNDK